MKLIKCYIENFGKLSKFSYDFNDNLNIIKQANGWGKTTLTTFIKAMFYGLPNSRGRELGKNEREKYCPWQGGNYGGNLEFAAQGKHYRIERFFGKTNAADTFNLFDLATGKVSRDFTTNVGAELFGVDVDGFERTLLIPQKILDGNINESVTTRLTNLIHGTTAATNYDEAQKILADRRRALSNRNGTGQIETCQDTIRELATRIETLNQSAATLDLMKTQVADAETAIAALQQTQTTVKAQIKAYGQTQQQLAHQEMYAHLQEQLAHARADLAAKQQVLNGQDTNLAEVESYLALNNDLVSQNPPTAVAHAGRKAWLVVMLLSALGLGIVALVQVPAVIGWVLLVLAAGGLVTAGSLLWLQRRRIAKNQGQAAAAQDSARAQVAQFLARFQIEPPMPTAAEKLFFLKQTLLAIPTLQTQVDTCVARLEKFRQEKHLAATVNDQNALDINELQQRETDLQVQIDQRRECKAQQLARISKIQDDLVALNDLENEQQNLAKALADLQTEFAAVKNAAAFLTEANDALNTRFLQPMQDGLRHYLKLLTGHDFDNIQLDTDLHIALTEYGRSRDVDYYSQGYQNTFALCLRLALIDALFVTEKPFIIMDDPLVNMDESKIANTLPFLRTFAKDHQLLYFSCHGARC